jgi:hypothetical protein
LLGALGRLRGAYLGDDAVGLQAQRGVAPGGGAEVLQAAARAVPGGGSAELAVVLGWWRDAEKKVVGNEGVGGDLLKVGHV